MGRRREKYIVDAAQRTALIVRVLAATNDRTARIAGEEIGSTYCGDLVALDTHGFDDPENGDVPPYLHASRYFAFLASHSRWRHKIILRPGMNARPPQRGPPRRQLGLFDDDVDQRQSEYDD